MVTTCQLAVITNLNRKITYIRKLEKVVKIYEMWNKKNNQKINNLYPKQGYLLSVLKETNSSFKFTIN